MSSNPKWKRDSMRRMWQERRGRRRRRDRRKTKKVSLLDRLLCFFLGHDSWAAGFRYNFAVQCRRCRRFY